MAFCWGGWSLLALSTKVGSVPNVGGDIFQFNLPGRLPEFAIGMWLASVWKPCAFSVREWAVERVFSFFFLGLILYAALAAPFLSTAILPLFHMFHVAACVVFFMILFLWTPAAKVGQTGLTRKLSEASYTIYIVHVPLFSYAGVLPGAVPPALSNFFSYLTLLFILCYVAAGGINRLAALVVRRLQGGEKYPKIRNSNIEIRNNTK
jgi:peptidoglycan/LPS O-acetylase OafA/YrhL